MLLLAIVCFGVLIGGIAQMILGRTMSEVDWPMAIGSGLLGSFVGGLVISLLQGDGINLRTSGILGSVGGALIVTCLWSLFSSRKS